MMIHVMAQNKEERDNFFATELYRLLRNVEVKNGEVFEVKVSEMPINPSIYELIERARTHSSFADYGDKFCRTIYLAAKGEKCTYDELVERYKEHSCIVEIHRCDPEQYPSFQVKAKLM